MPDGVPFPVDRIGITTPVVTLNPKGHGPWERDATPADLAAVARTADRLGFSHLTCSEHVAVPAEATTARGSTYWDPLATLSWLAAHTQRIGLCPHVLVLGYHHPLAVVKRYGTLDLLSGGRVILGVGVGSLREEFDLLGADFEGRGARADDAIAVIRAAWGRADVDGFVVAPAAPRTDVRIWVGGRSHRSLRRAIEMGDGWAPFGMDDAGLAAALTSVELPPEFEVVLWAYGIDPVGAPEAVGHRFAQLAALGATRVNVRFLARSRAHWEEQAEALAAMLSRAAS